jgi:hypothetical protein
VLLTPQLPESILRLLDPLRRGGGWPASCHGSRIWP